MKRPPAAPTCWLARWLLAALAWGSLPFQGEAVAQTPSGRLEGRPAFRAFSDRDGLTQNAIRALAFDQSGRLWAGTKDGACVYNGIAWQAVNLPDRDRSNFVTAMRPARDGGMWLGTEGNGLLHFKNGGWTRFDAANGLPGNDVTAVLETDRGALWVATQTGVGKREGGRWQIFTTRDGLPSDLALCLLEVAETTGEKALVAGTSRGIALYRGGRWERLREAGLPANPWTLSLLETRLSDNVRRLMIGTQSGLFHLELDRLLATGDSAWLTWETLARDGRLPLREATKPFVFALLTTRTAKGEPVFWAGTSDGAFRLQNGEWRRYATEDGLPVAGVWSLAESPTQGDALWIGTSGGGIVQISHGGWTSFTTANGLAGNSTYSLMETVSASGASQIWIGSLGGLARLGDGKRLSFLDPNLKNVVALTSSRDALGREIIWAGTTSGLFELSRRRWKPLLKGVVSALAAIQDQTGRPTLWIGTTDGLLRWRGGSATRYSTADGLPGNRIRCLLPSVGPSGEPLLWIGTQSGIALAALRADGFALVGTGAGPAARSIFGLKEIRNAGGERFLWAGTGNGVLRGRLPAAFDSGTVSAIEWERLSEETAPAIPDNTVYRIETDASGAVYLCTNKGVARLTLSGGANGSLTDAAIQTFSVEDGLPSRECNTGASMTDRLGRIWVGTIGGVALLDPQSLPPPASPKPLLIESARFFEQAPREGKAPAEQELCLEALASETPAFPHNRNNVAFRFALLSFFREADTRYRTQLVGLEPSPSDWSPAPRRDYTTLPSGRYIFRVWGRDAAGVVSGPAEVAFAIRPAPWQTWWAIGLYAAAAGGAIVIGFRLRLRQLVLRQQRLSSLVAERTRDLIAEKERTEAALDRIRQLNERLASANAALKDAHLQERERALQALSTAQQSQLLMLRYQINPHFLFNALNSIWALADENPPAIQPLVLRLSKFLRYSLTTANAAFVTLDEEMSAVQSYLEVQRARFEQKLNCEIEVSPEAKSLTIPPFLLQPLVENAIKFGMRTSRLPLRIRISARTRGDRLSIRVTNSGAWIAPPSRAGAEGMGIGLANVRRRIAEAFPGRAELRAFSRGGWVSLRLRLRFPSRP
ncbi:MAG: hypothetical protein CFK52_03015 [Chloracidobacterium sp. CP2_5A]|nr:MAG: hypothetical protein CFK52_03015 [Chloracidobacterium sp. CP2_5A]